MLDPGVFSTGTIALIMLGAFTGGFVNGLTGFGTGLSAMPIWLQALSPLLSTQLALAGSVAGQLTTIRSIWHAIDWRGLAPMLVAGLIGVPIGASMMTRVDVLMFKRVVGCVLVGYSVLMLLAGSRLRLPPMSRAMDVAVGFVSGVFGSGAGISGALPTVWAALQGWSKERRRAVFQAFNLTILAASLLAHGMKGLLAPNFFTALILALPASFAGVALGHRVYQRLDDRRFDRLVLIVLGIAGLGLLATTAVPR